MVILGLDYGRITIGLAIASGPLAEPLTNLRVSTNVLEKLNQICSKLRVEKIVIGISEGKMADETREFARTLQKKLNTPIVFQDETLTTKQTIDNLTESRAKKKKRRGPKHAFAASIILQEYLDHDRCLSSQS